MAAMRIEEIESRLAQGVLNLSEEVLGADCYASLCESFPGQRTFELTRCADPRRLGDLLTFTGTFKTLFPWAEAEAEVCILVADSDRVRQLLLILTLPGGVSASKYIRSYTLRSPDSVDEDLEELRDRLEFEGAHVLFSSLTGAAPTKGHDAIRKAGFDPEQLQRGVSFYAKGSPADPADKVDTGYIEHLTRVFALSARLPRRCNLRFIKATPDELSGYRLNCLFAAASPPLKLTAGTLALEYTGVELGLQLDGERVTDADFAVKGALTLGALPRLEFQGEYLPQFGAVRLSFARFPTLAQLLTALEQPEDSFPEPLKQLLQVQLSRLECVVGLSSELAGSAVPVLHGVALELSMSEPLELFSGVSVTPTLKLQLEAPFDAAQRSITGELRGSWQLAGIPLETTLSYPELRFRASLPEGRTLGFAEIERLFLPRGMVPMPNNSRQPEVTKLEVSGSLKAGTLYAELALDAKSSWSFTLPGGVPFVVRGIELAASLGEGTRACSLRGSVTLGGTEFELGAEYTSDQGFRFVGVLKSDVELDLAWLSGQAQASGLRNAGNGLVLRDVRFEAAPQAGFYEIEAALGFRGRSAAGALSIAVTTGAKATSVGLMGRFGVLDSGSDAAPGKSGGSVQELFAHLSQVVELQPFEPPEALRDLSVGRFDVEVLSDEEGKKQYRFAFGGHLALSEGRSLDVSLRVSKGVMGTELNGELTVSGFVFRLTLDSARESACLVATYSHWGERKVGLGELLSDVLSPSEGLEALNALRIDLKDVIFALSRPKTADVSKLLFGIDVAADIDLAKLPLVGQGLAAIGKQGLKVGVDDLQVLYATHAFDSAEVETFNRMLGAGVTALPVPAEPSSQALARGVSVGLQLNLGDFSRALTVSAPVNGLAPRPAPQSPGPRREPEPPPTGVSDPASWFSIDKTLGPVHFARVGVEYRAAKVWLLLDASLRGAGFELSLEGLAVGAPISPFDASKVEFALRGVGIAYKNGAAEIGGMLLKVPGTADNAPPTYSGAATLKLKQLTLSAFGSYTTLETPEGKPSPSLFVYALLDYPLGGPSFLFVTGLAAGFGYNRALKMPALEEVASFPLVQAAFESSRMPDPSQKEGRVREALASLSRSVRAEPGEHFLAVGMKFTSFEVVTSFVLLSVEFGKHLEVHLVGRSTLVAPSQQKSELPPLAEAELALVGSFLPEQGVLEVRAELSPSSHVISRDCQITGGFAFATWFGSNAHAGDFVLTLGGYHPHYQVPDHYPRVPRLALNWNVATGTDATLEIKGDAYFALTASALMAGGHLDADFKQGNIHAWFKAGADFLIAWQPYHYEASAYINVGAEVTFELFGTRHLELQVGADLELWGPEFSGKATIHYYIISFTVEFGKGARQPKALNWQEFHDAFLTEGVCGVMLAGGLVPDARKPGAPSSGPGEHLGAVNAKELRLVTNSRVPLKSATLGRALEVGSQDFGIAPMGLAAGKVQSTHTISLTRQSKGTHISVSDEFDCRPVMQRVPRALWGQRLKPELHGLEYIEDVAVGYEISPKQGKRGKTVDVDTAADPHDLKCTGFEQDMRSWIDESSNSTGQARSQKLKQLLADDKRRRSLLSSLGFAPEDSSLDATIADGFRATPRIGAVA